MFLEALGSALLGLALAWAAASRCPTVCRPAAWCSRPGVAGALFGAFLTHSALGVPAHSSG